METEAAHAVAVARRMLTLRIVGLVLLLLGAYIHRPPLAHRYMAFCAGCALIQLAFLDFPKPQAIVGAAMISVWELRHPRSYFSCFMTLKVFALASFGAEVWAGFHFLAWKTALIILVFTTVGIDLLASRILFLITGSAGLMVAIISGIILLTAT